jgi:hypothetical protein
MERDPIIAKLNHIVEELGNIYLGMSDTYPRFFDQLDRESTNFRKSNGKISSLSAVSQNIKVFMERKDSFSKENSIKEGELIKTIDKELDKLSNIEKGIVGMEECSEELELISLNAMVSALKAGNNGGAFPYITKELQRVSRQSRVTSNTIRLNGQNLDREYNVLIGQVRKGQAETGNDMGRVFEALEAVITRLSFYDTNFQEQGSLLENGIAQIKSPLYMILEEVQKHDIVRQSIDHIIISLEEIDTSYEEKTTEEKLNSLKFSCQVYELSRFIIEDIKESVCRSYDRFSHEKKDVEAIIDSLSREIETKGSEIGKDDIGSRIESIRRSVTGYFSSQSETFARKEMSAEYFDELIDELEDGIGQFAKVLNSIRNIHVASRIEVVKLKKLENMENIINSIDDTVGTMENLLVQISESVNEFRKVSGVIIGEFGDYFTLVKDQMQDSMTQLDPILKTIESFRLRLNQHFQDFSQVTVSFKEFTGVINDHLFHMDSLIKEIDRINESFDSERRGKEKELKELLKSTKYDDWALEGDRINNLINKFTIFIHKKVMTGGQDTNRVELDNEQASSSEITLF